MKLVCDASALNPFPKSGIQIMIFLIEAPVKERLVNVVRKEQMIFMANSCGEFKIRSCAGCVWLGIGYICLSNSLTVSRYGHLSPLTIFISDVCTLALIILDSFH